MRTKSSKWTRRIAVIGLSLGLYAFMVGEPTPASAQEGAAGPRVTRTPASSALLEAEAAAAEAEQAAEKARAFAESLAEEAAREAAREAALEAAREAARQAAIEAEAAAERAAALELAREAALQVAREAELEAAQEEAARAAARQAAREAARQAELQASQGAATPSASRTEIDEAVDRAEEAADEAWVAARAAERANRDRKKGIESGPYLGAAFVYGAERFEDDLVVNSSFGGAGFVGWRLNPHFAAEVRYTSFDSFDIQGSNGEAEIDGFAVTLNAKVYPIQTRIQPFVVVGVGGINFEQKTQLTSGDRFRQERTDAVFRFGAGLDLPLSEYLKLNIEAAYLAPSNDLSELDVTTFAAGLTYQF